MQSLEFLEMRGLANDGEGENLAQCDANPRITVLKKKVGNVV